MHIGRPVRELIAEPVVDPVPAVDPADESVAVRLDHGAFGPVGGPDDPGAASPARL